MWFQADKNSNIFVTFKFMGLAAVVLYYAPICIFCKFALPGFSGI